MKHVIMAVVAAVCIVAGGVAGHFLKTGTASAGEGAGHEVSDKNDTGHGDDHADKGHDKKPKEDKSAGKDSHGAAKAPAGGTAYYKFTREFVVPMIDNGRVESLVILNINLEVDAAQSQALFSMEPAIRDNIMTTLVGLSNDGRTFESITDIENYETIRTMVLMNLKKMSVTGINNVLILDMARQDI